MTKLLKKYLKSLSIVILHHSISPSNKNVMMKCFHNQQWSCNYEKCLFWPWIKRNLLIFEFFFFSIFCELYCWFWLYILYFVHFLQRKKDVTSHLWCNNNVQKSKTIKTFFFREHVKYRLFFYLYLSLHYNYLNVSEFCSNFQRFV